MFSGKGRPPQTVENDEAVIERIIADPGSIGYIDADSVDDRVKVLLRIP
jgi:ABC-type phosphate transport system substrate-binding protein